MIRFVYFDLGNTVLDYHSGPVTEREKEWLGLDQVRTQLEKWGIIISLEKLESSFLEPWTRDVWKNGLFSDRELQAEEYLYGAVGRKGLDYPLLIDIYHEPFRRFARPKGDILSFLGELRKRRILAGIISNTPISGSCHDKTLKQLGLLDVFTHRLYSYDAGIRKPKKEIFLLAAEISGFGTEEIIMVGDSFRADVETPLAMGMKAFLYDPQGLFERAPCLRISRFSELRKHLVQIQT